MATDRGILGRTCVRSSALGIGWNAGAQGKVATLKQLATRLNAWFGKESGKPVQVATEDTDLTAELKRGLSFIRREKPQKANQNPRKDTKMQSHNLANGRAPNSGSSVCSLVQRPRKPLEVKLGR